MGLKEEIILRCDPKSLLRQQVVNKKIVSSNTLRKGSKIMSESALCAIHEKLSLEADTLIPKFSLSPKIYENLEKFWS